MGLSFFHLAGIGRTIPEHCRLANRVALHQVPPEQRGISLCGACGQSSILKNNRAIVQEYRHLRTPFLAALPKDSCQSDGCENQGKAQEAYPGLYRKSGKTAKVVQRWKCKACLCTYSVGSSIKRQKRSHVNRDILWMLTNGTPISKICDFTELSPRDVYAKIDFIYDQIGDLTARGGLNWSMQHMH
jgi:hypothetical protein